MKESKKTIAQIREEIRALPPQDIEEGIKRYQDDDRAGVRSLCEGARKRLLAYRKELDRVEALCHFEKKYSDYAYICGVDEVGRGPLAGPVVAGAVILPKDCRILYINDSKKLSAAKREELDEIIRREALALGLGMAQQDRIDEINILNATYEAMTDAISSLSVKPDLLLNDAVTIPGVDIRQVALVGGDGRSISIGAASIVAKVFRDHMMEEYDRIYPGYGFASNKGYGTRDHIEALRRLGPCPIHRQSFIKNLL